MKKCSPAGDSIPVDQCSNNNYNGTPWAAGPWKPGSDAPTVAYSYKIAASQDPLKAAPVENWAMTGSTPAQWDTGGPFNEQLQEIKNTTAVMTLGANPILSSFINIEFAFVTVTDGPCSKQTIWHGWFAWYAYSPDYPVACANEIWRQNNQGDHLLSIYKTLLSNNNNVMVVQYPLVCPWSFGVWQNEGNAFEGPAKGNSCTSQKKKVSNCSKCPTLDPISQWDQAVAVANAMNDRFAAVVGQAQAWARDSGIDPSRIQMASPDQQAWSDHQAWSSDSWVFKNDTWIHPNDAGHSQLGALVVKRTCEAWGQWCGDQPAWVTAPASPQATVRQSLMAARIPDAIGNRDDADLPNVTKQGHPVAYRSLTNGICRVFEGADVIASRKDGTCRLEAYSAGGGEHRSLRRTIKIDVR